MSIMTAGTYMDLAGNSGVSDLNATVFVSLLSSDSVLGSTNSSSHLPSASMAGVIVGVVLGTCFAALLCFLVGMPLCLSQAHNQSTSGAALGKNTLDNSTWLYSL